MWDTYTGFSITKGFSAFLPITVVADTSASSSKGIGFNWFPKIRISSQSGIGNSVAIGAVMGFPESHNL